MNQSGDISHGLNKTSFRTPPSPTLRKNGPGTCQTGQDIRIKTQFFFCLSHYCIGGEDFGGEGGGGGGGDGVGGGDGIYKEKERVERSTRCCSGLVLLIAIPGCRGNGD